MKLLKKHEQKVPLEIGVFILLSFCALQNVLLHNSVSLEVFIFANIISLMGVTLGFIGSSAMILSSNIIIVSVSLFLLFFQPIIMIVPLKLFFVLSIPIYSLISYEVSRSIMMRKKVISSREDIARYLKNTDGVTGLRSEYSFYKKYEQFTQSMLIHQFDDERQLGLAMFQVAFFEQYVYQDERATEGILRRITETLVYTRYPEELFFYLGKGVFITLSTMNQNEQEIALWKKKNAVTQIQMSQIPYYGQETTHDLTIKMGELIISTNDLLTEEQALSQLYRRSEADLSAEYIV